MPSNTSYILGLLAQCLRNAFWCIADVCIISYDSIRRRYRLCIRYFVNNDPEYEQFADMESSEFHCDKVNGAELTEKLGYIKKVNFKKVLEKLILVVQDIEDSDKYILKHADLHFYYYASCYKFKSGNANHLMIFNYTGSKLWARAEQCPEKIKEIIEKINK